MMWKKIYDCMVRIKICMYILKNKETILSVGVLKWFLLFIIFLGERYEYWFIFYIHCLIFKALIEYHSMLS